jgi:3-methylcrotonyl-CoA carboxylase alpha subunit
VQQFHLRIDGREILFTATASGDQHHLHSDLGHAVIAGTLRGSELHASLDGHRQLVTVTAHDGGYSLFTRDGALHFNEVRTDASASEEDATGGLTAPMNGTVTALRVAAGARVVKGDPILIMEAMKMEHSIRAPADGVVAEIFYAVGDLVDGGAELARFEPDAD